MCACNACVPAKHLCKNCSTRVPSARSSQVPGRPDPKTDASDTQEQKDKHGEHRRARAASTHDEKTRRAGIIHGSTITTNTCQVPRRAKCQGVPSAKAPGRSAATTTKRITQAPATDPGLARHERAKTRTKAKTHVPSAKACQVPRRAKCQGVCAGSWAKAVRA